MKTKVVIFWDNSITAFVSFWGLPNQTAHPQTNLQLENVVKKEIPRTTQGMKEKQSGTSFDSNHISLVITVRIKLQTLITGLSTKAFRITARTSFKNGSAAQARNRIHGTVCMTSQLAVNFNSSQIFVACSHIYIYINVNILFFLLCHVLWWHLCNQVVLRDIPLPL